MEKKKKKKKKQEKIFFLKKKKATKENKTTPDLKLKKFDDYNVSYKYAYFGQGEPTPIMVPLPF
jgi:hypothetical protein